MIVATAGHIDHGKTLLVKTLTGVDTDRLPEEKARGISIDLGFAYLPLPGGQLIGFVDVPGHERFIRNMLAGVCGIDFALLVVAADDGIMPQTVEHLQILDLLRVTRGAALITKVDRVDEARVQQVTENVTALLAPTTLAGAPVVPVSAVTGTGIASVRELLERESKAKAARQTAGQFFRLAIDRAFTVAGSGTVVTGTVFNGAVAVGDKLTISPAGLSVRVRGMQIRGQAATRAAAGERCALNLTGADLQSVSRGDWLLAEPLHRPTTRLDARITVLPSETHPLEHWTPVHFHLATLDVTGRVAIKRGATLAPGDSALLQLVLDKPVSALRGDRFILRDQSANRTLGGGIVIDPFAPGTRRSSPARMAQLAALEEPVPETALALLAQRTDCVIDLDRFAALYNLTSDRATQVCEAVGIFGVGKDGRTGITREYQRTAQSAMVTHLTDFHRAQPQAAGLDTETLRRAIAPALPAEAFATLLRELVDARRVEIASNLARLPGHNATANAADEKLWQSIRPVFEAAAYSPPAPKDLAAQLKLKEAIVRDFLHRKAKSGELQRVTPERFYLRSTLAALAAIAQATAQKQPSGLFTAAQYRDATGVGRSLAIEILEHLDRLGITQRIGDARKMRKDYAPILGAAPAITATPRTGVKPAPAPANARSTRPAQTIKR